MKKYLSVLAALALLFACTPEKDSGEKGDQPNNQDELTITGDVLEVTSNSATITGYANLPFELGDAEVGIMFDKQQSFAEVKKVAASELDGNNKFTVTVTGLESSTTYYYKSYVQNGMAVKYGEVKSFTTEKSKIPAGAVDLGLSVYWAECNIGASAPEDYGDYYAWGETETKASYSWSTYKFGTSSSGPFSKYNTKESYGTVDNKTVLDPEDDVAHVKLDGDWRMPTDEEWTELWTKCTWTWTTLGGVNGYVVTGSNGNSIFLPAAGYRNGSSLYDAGSYGDYWSSSLYVGYPSYAWLGYFYSGNVRRDYGYRYLGHSVRPVSE